MGNGGSINGISFQDMFNYLIINTVVLALVYSNAGNELAKKVQDGSVAIDLIRPVSLKYFLLSQDLGNNLFVVVFNVLPVCLVSIAIFGFKLPSDIIRLCLFVLSLVNGVIIIFLINYIFGLLAFWLKSTWYIPWYTGALFKLMVLSGFSSEDKRSTAVQARDLRAHIDLFGQASPGILCVCNIISTYMDRSSEYSGENGLEQGTKQDKHTGRLICHTYLFIWNL
jgi:hypothetical protein